MSKLLLAGALLLATPALADTVEFYGGDADGRSGLSSEKNGLITGGAWVFDDFDHAGGPITALWGGFLINYATAPTIVNYEIRSGVRFGSGGTLVASGKLINPTYTPTGRIYFGFTERYIYGKVNHILPPGRYHMSLQPEQTPSGRSFLATAIGTDLGPTGDPNPPVKGTPLKNGNTFFHSAHFGAEWNYVTQQFGAGTWDFSYGVEVPEPGLLGMLALAAASFLRRR